MPPVIRKSVEDQGSLGNIKWQRLSGGKAQEGRRRIRNGTELGMVHFGWAVGLEMEKNKS